MLQKELFAHLKLHQQKWHRAIGKLNLAHQSQKIPVFSQ